MKNDLDTQLQRQFQSSELASYAEKGSTIKEFTKEFTKVVSGPYIPPAWQGQLQAMSTTKS